MQLKNSINLIGDLCGTVPVMLDLAKKHGHLQVFQTMDEGKWIYPMLPGIELVNRINEDSPFMELDISDAFSFAERSNIHMTQAYHEQMLMPTPAEPIRPDLNLPDIDVPIYDWVFAPFGRSAPEEQKWEVGKWVELAYALHKQGKSVCILGNSKHDNKFNAYKCVNEFDRPLPEVMNILKKSRHGCVSIVTGISQLCYALGVKNYVFCNQGNNWGRNPDAVNMETYIPRITVEEVLEVLRCQ